VRLCLRSRAIWLADALLCSLVFCRCKERREDDDDDDDDCVSMVSERG